MRNRLELQKTLEKILGTNQVYFQPPANVHMRYPAIVYQRSNIRNTFADNSVYSQSHFYTITVIDKDPDSEIVEKLSKLPMCSHDRFYTSENLNHDVFTLFY